MSELPPATTSPKDFFEGWMPEAFDKAELPPGLREADLTLGVLLEGDEGGEWTLGLRDGRLRVAAEPRDAAPLTLIQSVADWRGALWGERGGLFGRRAAEIFGLGANGSGALLANGDASTAALSRLASFDVLIRMLVTGGRDGDWCVDVKLGPGEIPAEPTTQVSIDHAAASALANGELDALLALATGKILVSGDVSILMRLQAARLGSKSS
ncbi:MAG: SCP2 sterol-binding domain-containing protein [Deltaproteobacteria bacterium]|nr:MAG: SCP2 sterol-binding domain-containing protein [Deltaproteobacteria bacterium]